MPEIPFVDVGKKWFEDIVQVLVKWFQNGHRQGLQQLESIAFGTPTPETATNSLVFGTPVSEPWASIYDTVVGGELMMLSFLILLVSVQGRHTLRIFNFSSGYEAQKTRKNAWTGAFLIMCWYWIGVLSLTLVDGFTLALIPSLGSLGNEMIKFIPSILSNPAFTLVMAAIGGLAMIALEALYYIRNVLLYIYMYGMPLGIAVAYGNLPIVSDIAKRLCQQFVPLAILPLPAAILFRGYEVLFVGDASLDPPTEFLEYLVAVSLPVLALYLSWKVFKYGTPLTARVIGTASTAAVTVGAVAAGGYVGGAHVASTAARYGPRAAAGHVVAQQVGQRTQADPDNGGTKHDNLADSGPNSSVPQYRRTENDP
ncbi:hypothetical protein [Haloprofundus marisrubri]|uniref:hypothetical protein n=1 Tax=Haloprofundus marisrubri TaxID=1514971 RepID=UPI0008F8C76C|nr:hypothetical protein [Haloprofundus marisrubri]